MASMTLHTGTAYPPRRIARKRWHNRPLWVGVALTVTIQLIGWLAYNAAPVDNGDGTITTYPYAHAVGAVVGVVSWAVFVVAGVKWWKAN